MKLNKIKTTLLIAILLLSTITIAIPAFGAETTDISYGSVGDGTAGLSILEAHLGEYSAEFYVSNGGADWAEVSIPVNIALKDITELNFWEYIESYTPNGWSVNVLLGVDADDDGDFEADVAAWHQGATMHTLEVLHGDSFVQTDGADGNPETGEWMETDALSITQWWTPDESGAGFAKADSYPGTFYDSFANFVDVFLPDVTQTSLIPDADARVKCVKLVIGGSGSWMDEKAYVDDVTIDGNTYDFEFAEGEPVEAKVTGDGSITSDDAGTTVTYTGADDATITIEDLTEDEIEDTTFSAVGDYVDVKIDDPDAVDQLEVRVYYTDADIVGLVEANLRMYWYEEPNWRACSHTGVDTTDVGPWSGFIYAFIRSETDPDPTQPTLEELYGTPFGPGDSMQLDSDFYKKVDEITVDAGHGSANTDPIRIDTMKVDATSTTDEVGIEVELTETGVNTGVFTGSFLTTGEIPPLGGYLVVSEGDTVYVSHDGVEVTATIDETVPVFTSVTDGLFYKNTDTITLTATLDEADYDVTADFSAIDSEYTKGDEDVVDGPVYTITYEISEDNTMADDEYTITVTAEDEAGNTAIDTIDITLDNTEPSVTEAEADPSVIQPSTLTTVIFTASVSDELSGVESVTIDLTEIGGVAEVMPEIGITGVYEYEWTDTVALEGDYVLQITATDTIGNINELEFITLQVIDDTEGPSDISFTEAEPICGGLIVEGLTAEDPLSGLKEYEIYVDEEVNPIKTITVEALASTTWTDGLYKGTLVLDLSGYVDATVEVTVVAFDYAGNDADPVTLFEGKVPKGEWYGVELYEGWNLVSLPLIPDSSDSGDILSLILDQGASGVVFSYGYDQYTDAWITNPTEMPDGYGYWLYVLADDVMIVEGIETLPAPSLPATYEFTEGWVLAGYKQIREHDLDDYLGSLETGSYYGTVFVWDAETPKWDTPTSLNPGQGFWIWMHSDQSLIAPLE